MVRRVPQTRHLTDKVGEVATYVQSLGLKVVITDFFRFSYSPSTFVRNAGIGGINRSTNTIMKPLNVVSVYLLGGLLSFAYAQNPEEKNTAIIGGIRTDEQPTSSSVKAHGPKNYVVKQSMQQRVGNRTIHLQEVEPPAQIVRNQQSAQTAVSTPEVSGIPSQLIIVSAIVSGRGDEAISHITLWNGQKVCKAVSRSDFRLMQGFSAFKANKRSYVWAPQIIDADIPGQESSLNTLSRVHRLPARGYRITEIHEEDKVSRQIIADLHELYRVEEDKLREAYFKRKQNAPTAINRKSSEPEKPVTIRFWKRDMAKENQQEEGRAK